MLRCLLSSIMLSMLSLCIFANQVFGDEPVDDTDDAKVFFTKGESLFEAGTYLEAAAAFQRAYDIAPHPAALVNIGYCYEYANEHAKAVAVYQDYLDSPFEKDPQTVGDVRNRLAMLKVMVGELHIQCQPVDCAVEVDGVYKGDTVNGVLAIVMNPDKYTVSVKGRDEQFVSREYRVEAGEKTNARFELGPESGVAPITPSNTIVSRSNSDVLSASTTDAEAEKLTRADILFYSLTGGAVAGGAMIAAFGALTLKEKTTYKDSGFRDADARDRATRNKLITNISVGITSLLAVGAITVKALQLRSYKREKRLSLTMTLDGGGVLGLAGRF